MKEATLQLMATTINILSGVGFTTVLMHFAMSQLWPKYPFKGFETACKNLNKSYTICANE